MKWPLYNGINYYYYTTTTVSVFFSLHCNYYWPLFMLKSTNMSLKFKWICKILVTWLICLGKVG